jgi:hypothetical protein
MLAGLMAVPSVFGSVLPEPHQNTEWIRTTWIGNDWITLAVGAPLLVTVLLLTRRGSTWGFLLWLGMLGYGVYHYALYVFGAARNALPPLYIAAFLLAGVGLFLALSHLPVADVTT